MLAAVERLVAELRRVGIPISVSEEMDALSALTHADLSRRTDAQVALRATLVKNAAHEHAFDTVFDLYFRPLPAGGFPPFSGDDTGSQPPAAAGLAALDNETLRELLVDALRNHDLLLQRALAEELVDRHANMQPGRPVAGTYYLYRTMSAINRESLVTEVYQDGVPPTEPLARQLLLERAEATVQRFQAEVEAAIRRRLVADRGAEAVAKTLRTPLPEDVAFLTASAKEIEALRETVDPLARKLAARLAERRRHRQGPPDIRRTVRRALSTGGVTADPVFRPPRRIKPRLVVLADVSGSVATFAGFTLYLLYALRGSFTDLRSFVFVDGVDEVTDVLAEAPNITDATRRINQEGRGVWLDGHSDYGHALDEFWSRWGAQLTSRTSVLILGDARSNYHAPRGEVVEKIRSAAARLYWLNPEPTAAWDSGDSVIGQYAPHCDGVVECRTVRQLKAFVEGLG